MVIAPDPSVHATVQTIAKIAAEVARENGGFEVAGVLPTSGDEYAEVLLTVKDCTVDPCRISIGVLRGLSESAMRKVIADELVSHLHLTTKKE